METGDSVGEEDSVSRERLQVRQMQPLLKTYRAIPRTLSVKGKSSGVVNMRIELQKKSGVYISNPDAATDCDPHRAPLEQFDSTRRRVIRRRLAPY